MLEDKIGTSEKKKKTKTKAVTQTLYGVTDLTIHVVLLSFGVQKNVTQIVA
jgi:metal-sulfur cluster biosynthetic enzyme